jgi:hypothetical protein
MPGSISMVSHVSMRSSGRVGCGPQHLQRHPHARPGGFSVHHEAQPHETHLEFGGGLSGPGEHDGQSNGVAQRPGVMLSFSWSDSSNKTKTIAVLMLFRRMWDETVQLQ